MKKIISIIFLLVLGTFIYSGVQLSKAFTSEIPEVDENLQIVKQKKKENTKNEVKTETKEKQSQKNEEKNVQGANTKNNTQNTKINNTKTETKQNIKVESPKEEVRQESVQSQPVGQTQQVQPQVEQAAPQPVEQPVQSSPRYETYPGNYTSWDECKSESINVAFETDARTMCYEAYTDSNGQPVYKIQIVY